MLKLLDTCVFPRSKVRLSCVEMRLHLRAHRNQCDDRVVGKVRSWEACLPWGTPSPQVQRVSGSCMHVDSSRVPCFKGQARIPPRMFRVFNNN